MSSHTSDFGSDRVDQADASRDLDFRRAHQQSTAPLEYRVLYVKNGRKQDGTFTSQASSRAETMRRQLGIDADNDKWALQVKGTDGRWGNPIGDSSLGKELKNRR